MGAKKRKTRERIWALVLAGVMIISLIPQYLAVSTQAATEDPVTVSFAVKDENDDALTSDLKITVTDASNSNNTYSLPTQDGKYELDLVEGIKYQYDVTKTGYKHQATDPKEFTAAADTPVDITMEMEDIQLNVDNLNLKVGDTAAATITNKISGASYTYAATGGAVNVDSSTGTITAVKEGTATITASYNEKTSNSVQVTVTKSSVTSTKFTATPEGPNNVRRVTLKMSILPMDATGTVSFYANDDGSGNPIQIVDVSGGNAECTYEAKETLTGDQSFSAAYSGSDKYNEPVLMKTTLNRLKSNYPLVFDTAEETTKENPRIETYDGKESTFSVKIKDETLKGRTVAYGSDDPALKVDPNGTVTVTGFGSGKVSTITATAAAAGYYLEDTKEYHVFVQKPVDLPAIQDKLTVENSVSKTYDGTDVFENVAAKLDKDTLELLGIYTGDLDTSKGLIFEFKGSTDSKDAGSYESLKITDITKVSGWSIPEDQDTDPDKKDITSRIICKNGSVAQVKAKATIEKKQIVLGVNTTDSYEVEYSKDVNTELKKMSGSVVMVPNTAPVSGESIDLSKVGITTELSSYPEVGQHDKVIKPDLQDIPEKIEAGNTATKLDNYDFTISKSNDVYANLTIKEMTLGQATIVGNAADKPVSFTVEQGSLYPVSDALWVNKGVLKAKVSDSLDLYFDQVMLKVDGTEYDLSEDGFSLANLQSTVTGEVWLQQKSTQANKSATAQLTLKNDTDIPKFDFGISNKATLIYPSWASEILFDQFPRVDTYSFTGVSATDDNGSGVKQWEYCIYKANSDENLSKQTLQAYAEDENTAWKPQTADSKIPVYAEIDGSTFKTGNYIVLVKVTDNVNNKAVYSSNGLVFDAADPQVKIQNGQDADMGDVTYFGEKISYKVTGTDDAGLKEISTALKKGSKEIGSNSWKAVEKPDGYKLSELTKEKLVAKTIDSNLEDGNDYVLDVTVKDLSGRQTTENRTIVRDTKGADITVSCTNADVKNRFYFDKPTSVTIGFKEKNFNKNDVEITIKVGNETKKIDPNNVEAVNGLKETNGITVAWGKDSEAGKTVTEYTDDRLNTLTVAFEKDGYYKVTPSCKDLAGNEEKNITYDPSIEEGFVIDQKEPKINVLFDSSSKPENEKYFSSEMKLIIQYKERNFNKDDAKFDVTYNGEAKTDLTLEQMLQLFSEEEKAAEAKWEDSEQSSNKATYTDDRVVSLTLTLPREGTYKIIPKYTDLAGKPNAEVQYDPGTDEFVIDTTLPTIEAEYSNNDVKNIKYFKEGRVMTIRYTDRNFDLKNVVFIAKVGSDISGAEAEEMTLEQLIQASDNANCKIKDELVDSQAGSNLHTYTNERVNTLTLTFDQDGEYYIEPKYTDLSGKDAEAVSYADETKAEKEFVVDTIAPEIEVTYKNDFTPKDVEPKEGQNAYSQTPVEPVIKITEKNFVSTDSDGSGFVTTDSYQKNSEDKLVEDGSLAAVTGAMETAENWSKDGIIHTNEAVTFAKDANYKYTFQYTDLAGNSAIYQPVYFSVDDSDPIGWMEIDEVERYWPEIISVLFDLFKSTEYKVDMGGSDETSGFMKLEYYKTPTPLQTEDEVKNLEEEEWVTLNVSGSMKAKEGSFLVPPNEQFVVYGRITDYAGNVNYIYPSNGAVADDKEPVIDITEVSSPADGVYGTDVKLNVQVEDPTEGDTYSGLQHVWYEVKSDGNKVSEYEADLLSAPGEDEHVSQSGRTYTQEITIPAEKFNSNHVVVTVYAEDYSGNSSEKTIELKIDTTHPKIDVDYDNDDARNGMYFRAGRTMTIKYTERNFEKDRIRFDARFNSDQLSENLTLAQMLDAAKTAGCEITATWGEDSQKTLDETTYTDARENELTIQFPNEGFYEIVPKCTDLAGHGNDGVTYKDGTKAERIFVIDLTNPKIDVDYDNNDARNGMYFRAGRTMTIKYTERYFDKDRVRFDARFNSDQLPENLTLAQMLDAAKKAGCEITATWGEDSQKTLSDATYTNARVNQLTIQFPNEGSYEIVPKCTDRAERGNDEVAYGDGTKAGRIFVIDLTDPEIKVTFDNNNVKNAKYFKAKRSMTIEYTERSFSSNEDGITFDAKIGSDIASIEMRKNLSLDEFIRYSVESGCKVEISKRLSDSQSGKNEFTYTNGRVNRLELTFEADGEYYIVPHCKDFADRTEKPVIYADGTKASKEFVVDKIAPVVQVIYTGITPKNEEPKEGQNAYSQTPVNPVIKITEKNFISTDSDGSGFVTNASYQKNSEGKPVEDGSLAAVTAAMKSAGNWSKDGIIHTNEAVTFAKDANYKYTFQYTDLAGNSAIYQPVYFSVDGSIPKGWMTIDEVERYRPAIISVLFDLFKSTEYKVDMGGSDETSGFMKLQYYKTPTPLKTEAEVKNLGEEKWVTLNVNGSMKEKDGTFQVSPNEQFVVYGKMTDYAGNVTYIYPTNGAVADNVSPDSPTIAIRQVNIADARNGIYNEDVKLEIDIQDPIAGNTYSGLQHVWYKVWSTGNVTEELERDLIAPITGENAYQSEDKRTFNTVITVDSKRFNSNDVNVQVYADDFSGNHYVSKIEKLKIDTTIPTIEVTFQDPSGPLNERYYNFVRVATVRVTERNFDPSAVRFDITNTDGVQPAISSWSSTANKEVSDEAVHTCTVTFEADGDYTFTLNTTDLAGNDSVYEKVEDFTVDRTNPIIKVSYDNNNAGEPGFYNADRTATITVEEHNFNPAEVNAMITASLQGTGVGTPRVGSWSTSGDTHTAAVTFSADADYTFDVDYTDLAGNAADDYAQDTFTVDKTAPDVSFFDIMDKSANKDVVAPGVNYSDVNPKADGASLTLKGAKHDAKAVEGRRTAITNGYSIKMADFARTQDVDDLYTLSAVIEDRAGNKTEKSVMFSVNRFGSVYVLSDSTKTFVDRYYHNAEQDVIVTEINVDILTASSISYGRDGEIVNLEAGKNYTVSESGTDATWKQYKYTISKDNFEKEGNYVVTFDSQDRAQNVGNNKIKNTDVKFVIDKTAPTVVVSGIEDSSQYRADSKDMMVNVADNISMEKVDVYIGIGGDADEGKLVHSYQSKEIQETAGELVYTIEPSNKFQNVRIVARDAAGNEAETKSYRVLVTSDLFVQYYSNKPLLIGSIVGVLLCAAGIYYILVIKRKKQEEN